MMSFLARSALCIGAVAAAASGFGPERLIAGLGREAREAADGAGRACLASSGCLRAGAAALAATSAPVPRGAASRAAVAAGSNADPHGAGKPVQRPGSGVE